MIFTGCFPARIVLYILLLSIINGCASSKIPYIGEIGNEPQIRVAILEGKQSVAVAGDTIILKVDGKEIYKNNGTFILSSKTGGFGIEEKTYYSDILMIEGRHLLVDGNFFRGSLSVIRENDGLTVINNLGLESYLFGLINREISSAWPIEAVKAQAVAARSYAYNKMRSNGMNRYHLKSSVLDQVYGGKDAEDERAREAVNKTRGEIVLYNGEPANTLYHSNCGGHTESADNVWETDYPYLRGVVDENCTNAPHYFWSYTTSFNGIRNLLFLNEDITEKRLKITILNRTKSGRVKTIRIGKKIITGEDLRKIIGYDSIKSTNFQMESDGYLIEFKGRGHGHGVGMCQWGAKGMAEKGYSYMEILQHYYQGAEIGKVY